MNTVRQLPLPVRLRNAATFENFFRGANSEAIAALRSHERNVWLYGAGATGKTHLLLALCAAEGAAYLDFSAMEPPPWTLEGLSKLNTLCMDRVDEVAGKIAWETALFEIYNASNDRDARLVFAARDKPGDVAWALPDLASRLGACAVYQLKPLDDAQRIEALRMRAQSRGLDLPDETAKYLLRRMPRDQVTLFRMVDDLDDAALSAQRRLTVPFVRDALTLASRGHSFRRV